MKHSSIHSLCWTFSKSNYGRGKGGGSQTCGGTVTHWKAFILSQLMNWKTSVVSICFKCLWHASPSGVSGPNRQIKSAPMRLYNSQAFLISEEKNFALPAERAFTPNEVGLEAKTFKNFRAPGPTIVTHELSLNTTFGVLLLVYTLQIFLAARIPMLRNFLRQESWITSF